MAKDLLSAIVDNMIKKKFSFKEWYDSLPKLKDENGREYPAFMMNLNDSDDMEEFK